MVVLESVGRNDIALNNFGNRADIDFKSGFSLRDLSVAIANCLIRLLALGLEDSRKNSTAS